MRYAIIDFNKKAKEYCASGEYNLRIYIYSNGNLIDRKIYSKGKVEELKERNIPVIMKRSVLKGVPEGCMEEAPFNEFFGKIRW